MLDNLEKIAYMRAFGSFKEDLRFGGFVSLCKMYLCKRLRILWKDPIWDDYTNEEIVIEYYSHKFLESESLREDFENKHGITKFKQAAAAEEFADWADSMMAKDEEEKFEESIEFTPDSLGDV